MPGLCPGAPPKGLPFGNPRSLRRDVQSVAAGEALAQEGDERVDEIGGALLAAQLSGPRGAGGLTDDFWSANLPALAFAALALVTTTRRLRRRTAGAAPPADGSDGHPRP